MTTPMTTSTLSNMPYDDVYLDQLSTDDDDDDDELDHQNVTISLNKPLMSPRKPKVAMRMSRRPTVWQVRQQKRCLKMFYVVMMISVISLVAFVLFRITNDYESSLDDTLAQNLQVTVFPNGTTVKVEMVPPKVEVVPCTHFSVEDVWIQNMPMLQTESAIRLVDVNKDGVLDVIMGFTSAVNGYFNDENLMCAIYFGGKSPCFGGVMALDGKTGTQLWKHGTKQDIFAINCNVDIDKDGVKDCLAAGRMGLFMLLSGATGDALWTFADTKVLESISNLYTAQFIQDMDGDGVQDVLNIHGGDPFREKGSPVSHIGKLVIFSGTDGHVISYVQMPDNVESYYSPQVYYKSGGVPMVLFGSGGETQSGSLWVMPLHDIMEKSIQNVKSLYRDEHKGVMTPPVLVDITGDGVEDIVMAMFNSTIVAINGETYKQLWNYSVPASESYSTPSAGYYNDDDIPDFLINNNVGPGYPIYFRSEVTILDGRNGRPLLSKPIISAGSAQSSALTISMEGHGNDAFVFFNLDCLGHEGEGGSYEVWEGSMKNGKQGLSKLDFCQQRFKTETYSRLFALNQHTDAPGEILYNSIERKSIEYQYKVNSSHLAKAYLDANPTVFKLMLKQALERAKEGGKEERNDVIVGTHDDETLEYATTNRPTNTQEYYDRKPVAAPNGFTTISSDDNIAAESAEDEEEDNYNTLLEKLQEFLDGLKDDDTDTEEEEGVDATEEDYGGDFVDNDVPKPQKRPYYDDDQELPADQFEEQPDSMLPNDRYNSDNAKYDLPNDRYDVPNNRYNLPDRHDLPGNGRYNPAEVDSYSPSKDRYQSADVTERYDPPNVRYNPSLFGSNYNSYNAKSDIYKLLNKYPWLAQELGEQTSPSDRYLPPSSAAAARKRRPDARLPGRQWGRGWARERRAPLAVLLGDKWKGPFRDHGGMLDAHSRQRREVLPEGEKQKRGRVHGGPSPGTSVPKQSKRHLPEGVASHKRNSHQHHHSNANQRTGVGNQLHYQLLKSMQSSNNHKRTHARGNLHKDPFGQHQSSLSTPSRGAKRRFRRHAGLHDSGGTMRLISTASLAPSMSEDGELSQSIDIVFATYWFYPGDDQIILPEESKCLDKWAANETQRMSPGNRFYGQDHDAYEHEGMLHCIKNDHQAFEAKSKMLKSMNPLDIFPFNVHAGEMTVYRLRVTCHCGLKEGGVDEGSPKKRCAKVLPYKDQQWAGYMGTFANSHFQPRKSP